MTRDEQRQVAHRVFWADRRWFEQNSDSRLRRRPYVPGEFTDAQTDEDLRERLKQATEVEVWWSDAAAHGRTPLRFRRVEEVGVTWTDPEDACNWMLNMGPPTDEPLNRPCPTRESPFPASRETVDRKREAHRAR